MVAEAQHPHGWRGKVRAPRDRNHPLQAYVTPDERAGIEARARMAGLSLSAYIRAACLSGRIASAMDLKAVATLAQINADQARLGNLLKFYLQEAHPDHAAATRLLGEIRALQVDLKDAVKRVQP